MDYALLIGCLCMLDSWWVLISRGSTSIELTDCNQSAFIGRKSEQDGILMQMIIDKNDGPRLDATAFL